MPEWYEHPSVLVLSGLEIVSWVGQMRSICLYSFPLLKVRLTCTFPMDSSSWRLMVFKPQQVFHTHLILVRASSLYFILSFLSLWRKRGHDPANTSQDKDCPNLRNNEVILIYLQASFHKGWQEKWAKKMLILCIFAQAKLCKAIRSTLCWSQTPQNKYLDVPWLWPPLSQGFRAGAGWSFPFPPSLSRYIRHALSSQEFNKWFRLDPKPVTSF